MGGRRRRRRRRRSPAAAEVVGQPGLLILHYCHYINYHHCRKETREGLPQRKK
jgi:hypothetical protein